MSVVIEAISVVTRVATLEKKYKGGLAQYQADCPNNTFCTDGDIVRVGFMTPVDVMDHRVKLERHGLIFKQNNKAIDIVVVDQFNGPTVKCDWLVFRREVEGYSTCSLVGAKHTPAAFPNGWNYETSLSKNAQFVKVEDQSPMVFVRREKDYEVYRDKSTGKTMYQSRTTEHDGQIMSASDAYKRGTELISPYLILDGSPRREFHVSEMQRDINEGLKLLRLATSLEPENWPAFWFLGKAYQALGGHRHAYDNLKKAFEIKPDHVDICRELVMECLELGLLDEGVLIAKAAVQLQPSDAGLLGNLGFAQLLGGQLDEARHTLEQAVKLVPSDEINKNVLKLIEEVQSGVRPQPHKISDLKN